MNIFSSLASLFTTKPPVRKYGLVKDENDNRDYLYAAIASRPLGTLPSKIDMRAAMPAVYDQGQLGSCTGNAIAGAMQYVHMDLFNDSTELSRLFVYYNERVTEGTISQDAGAMIRDGVKSVADKGICSAKLWPYVISKFTQKPPVAAYTDAAKRKVASYHRITGLDQMKQCLAEGFPFVFGFTVYEGFESAEVAKTGVLNMPGANEQILGGHAVLCVGYDDTTQRVIIRNSWGSIWGQNGYFTMPYSYINSGLASDMWTIRK